MANGIIVIDKPQGWTSMDVCAKLRGIFREKRIGHAGTLDPMATGVLPVFVGRATRAVEFASEGAKEYVAGLKLGVVTNTQDISGEVLEQHPAHITPEQLEQALNLQLAEQSRIEKMLVDLYPDYKADLLSQETYLTLKKQYEQQLSKTQDTICNLREQLAACNDAENTTNDFISTLLRHRNITKADRRPDVLVLQVCAEKQRLYFYL